MAMDAEQAGRGHRSDSFRIGKCSVGSRLRSLRSPLRGLDPTSALPRSRTCRSGGRLWIQNTVDVRQSEDLAPHPVQGTMQTIVKILLNETKAPDAVRAHS